MSDKKYRSIFISDVHLGTRDCKAEQLNNSSIGDKLFVSCNKLCFWYSCASVFTSKNNYNTSTNICI